MVYAQGWHALCRYANGMKVAPESLAQELHSRPSVYKITVVARSHKMCRIIQYVLQNCTIRPHFARSVQLYQVHKS